MFTNFTFGTTGLDMPSAANINVLPTLLGGNFGLTFQGLFHANPGNGISTASIAYTVSTLRGGALITDLHLDGDPVVNGGDGHASVSGSASDTITHTSVIPRVLSIFDNTTGGIDTARRPDHSLRADLLASAGTRNDWAHPHGDRADRPWPAQGSCLTNPPLES